MASEYTNTKVTEFTNIDDDGQVVEMIRVTATSTAGVRFSISTTADSTPEKVGELLAARATNLDAIKNL